MSLKAAQYVRMSTDQQSHSIDVQKIAIQKYAESNGIEIVRTFADEGRSGISLDGRPAMRELLQMVERRSANFKLILVLDVSRWGRFQDADEAGYHEFHCRKHGVRVTYVAEPSESTDSPYSSLVKQFRRMSAADYSRDLAVKSRAGIAHAVNTGSAASCLPCLGYRRMAVSAEGIPKRLLSPKERKPLATDRVRWVVGPPDEVEEVRQIFTAWIGGKSLRVIAADLIARNIRGHDGKPMSRTRVQFLLQTEALIGQYEWGGHGRKGTSATNLPPLPESARNDHVPAILERSLWDRAQARWRVVRSRCNKDSNAVLAQKLREALQICPGLPGIQFVQAGLPNAQVYRARFGTLWQAYEAAGILETNIALKDRHATSSSQLLQHRLLRDVRELLISFGVAAELRLSGKVLFVGGVRVDIRCAFEIEPSGSGPRWFVRVHDLQKADQSWMLLMRLNPDRLSGKDFFLMPPQVYKNFLGIVETPLQEGLGELRLETAAQLVEAMRAIKSI